MSEQENEKASLSSRTTIAKIALRPARFSGEVLRLEIQFKGEARTASETECGAFNLEYGNAVKRGMQVIGPDCSGIKSEFDFTQELFAYDGGGDWLIDADTKATHKVSARVAFGQAIVRNKKMTRDMKRAMAFLGLDDEDKPTEEVKYLTGLILEEVELNQPPAAKAAN